MYRYKFIVDGEVRHNPDLPAEGDETGIVYNLLDVNVSAVAVLFIYNLELYLVIMVVDYISFLWEKYALHVHRILNVHTHSALHMD